MLVDANLLLYAIDTTSRHHRRAVDWLTAQLAGTVRVGIPWDSIGAFLRIATHPRAARHPLGASEAWSLAREWLAQPTVWTPLPTERHADVLGELVEKHHVTGNLIPDAHLAALAIEHGLTIFSADTDFARFPEIRWKNPLV